jgi:hypothetical protein
MARNYITIPWDSEFPQICVRCSEPATTTTTVKLQKPSTQQWFFWFGLIGAAIAGARKGGSISLNVPYCDNCARRNRNLLLGTWGAFILCLILLCGYPMLFTIQDNTNETMAILGVIGLIIGALLLVIAVPVLVIMRNRSKSIQFMFTIIQEQMESVRVSFRNPTYLQQFIQQNIERLVTFALRYDQPLLIPADQAVSVVARRIDEHYPRSPQSLSGYFELGQIYLQSGMFEQAIANLDWVMNVTGLENPYFLDAQYFRGQAHMSAGHISQAQTDFENYLVAASNKPRIKKVKNWLKQLKRT